MQTYRSTTISFCSSIALGALVMGIIWAGWGLTSFRWGDRTLVHLPVFGCLLVVIAALIVSSTVAPASWVLYYNPELALGKSGSRPEVFATWLVCSYPLGCFVLFFWLALLHGLCQVVEVSTLDPPLKRPWRAWQGHFYYLRLVAFRAFNWGFFTFWGSTFITMYLFNLHKGFCPPYSPLGFLGLAAGTIAFCWRILSAASPTRDFHRWYRERAEDTHNILKSCPWIRERDSLLNYWNIHVAEHMAWNWLQPRRIFRYSLNR